MPNPATSLPRPLREGDRLDSSEFIRRWEAMPELKGAELIDGTVFMSSPAGKPHGHVHLKLARWLSFYIDHTPGCDGGIESTWLMAPGNVPQPDASLRILPASTEQDESGKYYEGVPHLAVEISDSTLSRELGIKLELYRHSGVREYLTVLLNPKQIIWRELKGTRYREIKKEDDGLLHSRVFPGLWLDPEAVWDSKKIAAQCLGTWH